MTEPTITLTITIPEDAVRGINDFMDRVCFETFLNVLRSRDVDEAFRMKYALSDIRDAINNAARGVKP